MPPKSKSAKKLTRTPRPKPARPAPSPRTQWSQALKALNPCDPALEWARELKSLAIAWKTCKRGDWMLWLLGAVSGRHTRKPLALCAGECARLALHVLPKNEKRPQKALEEAEAWATCSATHAACIAFTASKHDVAGVASTVASAAANAVSHAAVSHAADSADVRTKVLARCARIVRKHYPKPPRLP